MLCSFMLFLNRTGKFELVYVNLRNIYDIFQKMNMNPSIKNIWSKNSIFDKGL